MSKEALAKVIQRSISDGGFRRQLATDPTGALRGYELTSDEAAALRSGDAGRLSALGVEQRMSKAFTLASDGATGSGVSFSVTSDLGASGTGAVTTGGAGTAGSSAMSGTDGAQATGAMSGTDGAQATGALTSADGSTGSAALISGDASDTDPLIVSGANAGAQGVIPSDPAQAFAVQTGGNGSFDSVLTEGDDALAGTIHISDDSVSGATNPGDAVGGPDIQQ